MKWPQTGWYCDRGRCQNVQFDAAASISILTTNIIWGLCCRKQVSQAGISNSICSLLWDEIAYPCLRYLLLATKSSNILCLQCNARYEKHKSHSCHRWNNYILLDDVRKTKDNNFDELTQRDIHRYLFTCCNDAPGFRDITGVKRCTFHGLISNDIAQ